MYFHGNASICYTGVLETSLKIYQVKIFQSFLSPWANVVFHSRKQKYLAIPGILSTSNSNWQVTSGLKLKSHKVPSVYTGIPQYYPCIFTMAIQHKVHQISLCILSLKAPDIFLIFQGHLKTSNFSVYPLSYFLSCRQTFSKLYAPSMKMQTG